jgi:hypothetical protein
MLRLGSVLAFMIVSQACVAQAQHSPVSACSEGASFPVQLRRGIPSIAVRVNGQDVTAYLDTGALPSAISEQNLAVVGGTQNNVYVDARVNGPQDGVRMRRGSISAVELGRCRYSNVPVVIAPATAQSNMLAGLFDTNTILLGREFMDGFGWSIDLPNKVVRLTSASAGGGSPNQTYSTAVTLHGQEMQCTLDTGLVGPPRLFMFAGHPLAHGLLSSAPDRLEAPLPISPSGRVTQVMVADGTVSGLAGRGLVVDIEARDPGQLGQVRNSCVVGLGLLQDAVITLEPNTPRTTLSGPLPPPLYNRSGVTDAESIPGPRPMLEIQGLRPGSSFAKAGIRIGDRIVQVDQTPFTGEYRDASALFSRAAGSRFTLKILRSGQEIDVPVIVEEALHDSYEAAPAPR